MRAFEFKNPTVGAAPTSTLLAISDLLQKTEGNPKAFNTAAKGIDTLLDASNRMVAIIKKSKIFTLNKPKLAPSGAVVENVSSIPAYHQRIDSIEGNIKLLRSFEKNPELSIENKREMLTIINNFELEIVGLRKAIENDLKSAAESYKSLDPLIKKMLTKVYLVDPQSIAIARSIFLNDEIPIQDAKHFLEVAQTGVIDLIPMVKKSKGTIDQYVVNDAIVRSVYNKVIDNFLNWIPGKTAGNIGPGEFALVMLGNPAGKEKKGDLKIGDEMFEVKAGSTKSAELKKGGTGIPSRTGAIFDTGVSGKAIWPDIEKILKNYGFKNMTEIKLNKNTQAKETYTRYNLQANNFENYNQEFDRLKMNLSQRAELLTKIAEKIFPSSMFDFKQIKFTIQNILKGDGGKLVQAPVPPGESTQIANNNALLRYLNRLALNTYREEGSSKDNFLFFNKTTRQYRVYKGTQLDQELSKEGSELKLISGIAFSQKDKQSKATPRMTLG
jgi:hypothetical protein